MFDWRGSPGLLQIFLGWSIGSHPHRQPVYIFRWTIFSYNQCTQFRFRCLHLHCAKPIRNGPKNIQCWSTWWESIFCNFPKSLLFIFHFQNLCIGRRGGFGAIVVHHVVQAYGYDREFVCNRTESLRNQIIIAWGKQIKFNHVNCFLVR